MNASPLLLPSLLAIATAAPGLESFVVGPRALAMGGANVASTEQGQAQFYNPAAFGFFGHGDGKTGERVEADRQNLHNKDFGFGLDATVGYRVHENFAKYVDQLAGANYEKLGKSGIQTTADAKDAILIADAIGNIGKPGNAITGDFNAGTHIRIGHFAIGARGYSQVTGVAKDIDLVNLGLFVGGAALGASLATNSSIPTGNSTLDAFTSAQAQSLYVALGGNPASSFGDTTPGVNANATAAVRKLDDQALSVGLVQGTGGAAADVLTQAAAAAAGNSLDKNTTKLFLSGYALAEIPVTYGHPITDHIAIGVSLKGMIGRVYATEVLVFQDDSMSQLQKADENYKQSFNLGLDVGVMMRWRQLQFGLTGRNLNSPTFEGPELKGIKFPDLTVKPQVTIGAAWIPHDTFTIEVDADLIPGDTTLNTYKSQKVGAGLEWDILHFLALRGGVSQNIAETDSPLVVSGGLGFDFWLARLDLAAAFSPETVTVDGEELPREARGSLALTIDF